MTSIENRFHALQQEVRSRSNHAVDIVVVTKYTTLENIAAVAKAGAKNFGENRVQQLTDRYPFFQEIGGNAHLIGHLQTNKAKKAVTCADYIQSVDSIRLVETLSAAAKTIGKIQPILLQVNVANEPQKTGFSNDELIRAFETTSKYSNLRVEGLMTMAPEGADEQTLGKIFAEARHLFERLRLLSDHVKTLSMGMSQDFKIALSEGSTMIRVGSALFA